ncbi:unnamed protein product [Lactuca saligna]|uniref:Uncharacterized protein n=1 Tax=Lactuca saligna TaxID=75948 RepID=A0AA36DXR6_LACSI|nr:unnamed protein product [Lactuca saligna]
MVAKSSDHCNHQEHHLRHITADDSGGDPALTVNQQLQPISFQNEDFHSISQVVARNAIAIDNEVVANDVLEDGIGEEYGIREEDDEESFAVPSTFTTMEETNMTINNNWLVSQLTNKNDFTQELGKYSFKDKELTRAIKLYSIRTHKQFELLLAFGIGPGSDRNSGRPIIDWDCNSVFNATEIVAVSLGSCQLTSKKKKNVCMIGNGRGSGSLETWLLLIRCFSAKSISVKAQSLDHRCWVECFT